MSTISFSPFLANFEPFLLVSFHLFIRKFRFLSLLWYLQPQKLKLLNVRTSESMKYEVNSVLFHFWHGESEKRTYKFISTMSMIYLFAKRSWNIVSILSWWNCKTTTTKTTSNVLSCCNINCQDISTFFRTYPIYASEDSLHELFSRTIFDVFLTHSSSLKISHSTEFYRTRLSTFDISIVQCCRLKLKYQSLDST